MREPLPLRFLFTAAPGYLTNSQRAEAPDDWEEKAIEYAFRRVKNVTAAFSLVPKGKGIGHLPNVVDIADYLNHCGRKSRALLRPPESFWEAAASEIFDAREVERLSAEALKRLQLSHGVALADRAATLGSEGGLWELAFHNSQIGDHQEAERIFRRIGDSGDPEAWVCLASMMEDDGEIEASREIYAKAADMGHLDGLRDWADSEAINDREGTAAWIYRLLISKGDAKSLHGLASLMELEGEMEEAERLYREAVAKGNFASAHALAHLLEEAGRKEEAKDIALLDVMPEDSSILLGLMLTHEHNGKSQEAEVIFWKLIESGDEKSAAILPWVRTSAGKIPEAKKLAIDSAERGCLESLIHVISQCIRDKRDEEVQWLLDQLVCSGGSITSLSNDYSLYLERNGKSDEAEVIAADDDRLGSYNLLQLAEYRVTQGNVASARQLATRLLQEGVVQALAFLVDLEEADGNLTEAERLARKAVDAGEFGPLQRLVEKYPRNESLASLLRDGRSHR
ncbi:tetratricopeptide repeat protein [Streptomyces sp. NPDC052415]|uniref:tetratricopeptide repeat protein n=1 Tax=Streptomyces sp. NPDC052415 TaxID=3365690 RepID=UPI0037CD011C